MTTKDLLAAIREYTDEHSSDGQYEEIVKELAATATALESHSPTEEDTPGKQQTRRAIQVAREKQPEKPPEKKDREAPKSFAEARERAMQDATEDSGQDAGEGAQEAA